MACVRSYPGGEVVPGQGYDPAWGTTRVRPHPKNGAIAGEMVVPHEGNDRVLPGTRVTSYPVVSPYRGTARGTTPLWPHLRRELGALKRWARTLWALTLSAHGLGSLPALGSPPTHLRGAGGPRRHRRRPPQGEGTPTYPTSRLQFPAALYSEPQPTCLSGGRYPNRLGKAATFRLRLLSLPRIHLNVSLLDPQRTLAGVVFGLVDDCLHIPRSRRARCPQ